MIYRITIGVGVLALCALALYLTPSAPATQQQAQQPAQVAPTATPNKSDDEALKGFKIP